MASSLRCIGTLSLDGTLDEGGLPLPVHVPREADELAPRCTLGSLEACCAFGGKACGSATVAPGRQSAAAQPQRPSRLTVSASPSYSAASLASSATSGSARCRRGANKRPRPLGGQEAILVSPEASPTPISKHSSPPAAPSGWERSSGPPERGARR